MLWADHDHAVGGDTACDVRVGVSRPTEAVGKERYGPAACRSWRCEERGIFEGGDLNVVEEAREESMASLVSLCS